MAKIVVVVEIKDKTAAEVVRDATAVEGMGDPVRLPDGWDVLAMIWGGDLEHLQATAVVDVITD